MTYYRLAIQDRRTATWSWRTTALTSLQAVFHLLRRYRALPQDRVRVFMASSPEEMPQQLAQENTGLGSHSVPVAHFLHEHLLTLQPAPSHAGAPRPSSNESARQRYPHDKRGLRTLERTHEPEQLVHPGDFWNISDLAAA